MIILEGNARDISFNSLARGPFGIARAASCRAEWDPMPASRSRENRKDVTGRDERTLSTCLLACSLTDEKSVTHPRHKPRKNDTGILEREGSTARDRAMTDVPTTSAATQPRNEVTSIPPDRENAFPATSLLCAVRWTSTIFFGMQKIEPGRDVPVKNRHRRKTPVNNGNPNVRISRHFIF
jgi:hypothetical protein